MKNIKLIITLLIIAAGTEILLFAFTTDSEALTCEDCIVRMDPFEETALNKFCYPSIYSQYAQSSHARTDERLYPKTWLFAGTRNTNVCLQVVDRAESNLVSF